MSLDMDIEPSLLGKRSLTPFHAHEMLYEYLEGRLDSERKRIFEGYLAQDASLRGKLSRLKTAQATLEKLKSTEPSTELIRYVRKPSSYSEILLTLVRFAEWPLGLRVGSQILIVVVLCGILILLTPWNIVLRSGLWKSQDMILSEVTREALIEETPGSGPNSIGGSPVANGSPNEAPDKTPAAHSLTEGSAPSADERTTSEASYKDNSALISPVAYGPPRPLKPATVAEAKRKSSPGKGADSSVGVLYRGTLVVENLEAATGKYIEIISSMGGKKAGEVNLGWRKPQGTYFHFSIPEDQMESLKEKMSGDGVFELQREKHPRVMPEGTVRWIITIIEKH